MVSISSLRQKSCPRLIKYSRPQIIIVLITLISVFGAWGNCFAFNRYNPLPYQYQSGNANAFQMVDNPVILQSFYWFIGDEGTHHQEPESNLWQYIADVKAREFKEDGFTHVWLPPTGKAFSSTSKYNVGYAIYDHYDLGEFHQMGRVRTKYGTKDELHRAVDALHSNGLKVIADIVMNHMLGSHHAEEVPYSHKYVFDHHSNSATFLGSGEAIAYLHFDFPARGKKYSDFVWRREHFDGMENYDQYYLFRGKRPDKVSYFNDSSLPHQEAEIYKFIKSDIILGADLDFEHHEVREEMLRWTKWLIDEVGFDGLRVDAIKHIHTPFVNEWANRINHYMAEKKKDFLIFGEAWDGWAERLSAYLGGHPDNNDLVYNSGQGYHNYCGINYSMSLFDVPLHYDFQKIAGENHSFPPTRMIDLPKRGLLAHNPHHTVTFVDNHDTIPSQELASYIPLHTKLQAYTYILLNEFGIPTVFYRDMYKGNYVADYVNNNYETLHYGIKDLLRIRKNHAYGRGEYYRYENKPNILGYRRFGDHSRPGSGLIYLIRTHGTGDNGIWINSDGHQWELAAGNGYIENGRFFLPYGSNWAVWIPRK